MPSKRSRGGASGAGGQRPLLLLLLFFLLALLPPDPAGASADRKIPLIGPVKMNPHPVSLEGKTVLLRWNGKYNGDKFLHRAGELLSQRVRNLKIVEMWKADASTAVISKTAAASEQITAKIAQQKPDLVIAGQGD